MNLCRLLHLAYVLFTLALLCILITQLYLYQESNVSVPSPPEFQVLARDLFNRNFSKTVNSSELPNHFTVSERECGFSVEKRFDCARDRAVSQTECEKRGCCYSPLPQSEYNGPPWCFYPASYPGYKMGPLSPSPRGQSSILTRVTPSYLPGDISTLKLQVMEEEAGRLHLTLRDPSSPRYEVPFVAMPSSKHLGAQGLLYDVEFKPDPFGFSVSRRSNGRVLNLCEEITQSKVRTVSSQSHLVIHGHMALFKIFPLFKCSKSLIPGLCLKIYTFRHEKSRLNTSVAPLLFADQYLQLSTSLASTSISGFGEHYTHLTLDLNWTSVTMWNRDMAPHSDVNLYGSHPFCLVQEEDGQAHGIFFLNSNAMEVALQPMPALTWVTIGGILDIYIFLGPDPQSVVRQYHEVIGYPMMPPYWSLGFHLCRWGYTSTNVTRGVVQKMRHARFPLDVQWNDLDYADKKRVFTFDPERFGDLPEMVREFHEQGMKYVLILDPGISTTSPPGSYKPFDVGEQRGVFIKNLTGQTLIGKVWPGPTAFPDFTNPETVSWWEECIRDFHANVSLDGLWIDMNEPASFVQGSVHGCPDSVLETPPYTPDVIGGQLNSGTLCMTGQQTLSSHYNLHNLYGLTEAIATYSALLKARRSRPFVLSRSSFPGLGRFSGHWTGDVYSDWEQLRFSVPAVLLFGLYGVPLVGADVCGFEGDTNEELCVRWTQLGAFYPFMRNHNDRPNAPQEPYVFGQQAQAAMRNVTMLRYSLLPFLYTLFHHAHTTASTVARPLFMEFPSDPNCLTIDRQFLWGSSLLISPVLEEGLVDLAAYLPPAMWYSFHNGQPYNSKGQYLLLPAPLDTMNVHVRGGHIIPQQVPALTTSASRRNPFLLTVALCSQGQAEGELFWDDGDSLGTFEQGDYSYIIFTAGQSQLVGKPLKLNGALDGLVVGEVRVFGVLTPPTGVWANGQPVKDFSYITDTKVLTVSNLALLISETFTVQWTL